MGGLRASSLTSTLTLSLSLLLLLLRVAANMATSELGSEESGPSLPCKVGRGPIAADEDGGDADDEEDSLVWRLQEINS